VERWRISEGTTLAVGLFHPWGDFNGRRHACRVDARAGRGRTKSKRAIAPRHFHARCSVAIGARRLITRRLANETSTLLRRLFRCWVRSRLHPARAYGKLVMSALPFWLQQLRELSTLVRNWIEAKLAHTSVERKVSASRGLGDQIIRIEGGLPKLPGTQTIMPNLNNGHQIGQALPAPEPTPAESVTPEQHP
jgi:hypothetical protein